MGVSVPQSTEKIWGRTTALIASPLFELHRLFVKPQHRCSMHVHRTKHNAFYVLNGVLFVDTLKGSIGGDYHEHVLVAGDTLTVPPGVHHQFRTGDGACELLEAYYTETLGEDIVRVNAGGPIAPICSRCGARATPEKIGTCGYYHTSNSCPHRKGPAT